MLLFFKTNQNYKIKIYKETKCEEKKKKLRDQNAFELLGHQVCLETKQLGGKKQIILPINSEGISHTKLGCKKRGGECFF